MAGVSGASPTITVTNAFDADSYNAAHGTQYSQPTIVVLSVADGGVGISNPQGDVNLINNHTGGDILLLGPVEAKNLTILAGGELFIEQPVFEVGGSPSEGCLGPDHHRQL